MKFIAKPYKLIVVIDGRETHIPVVNANGVYKSVELDGLKSKNGDALLALYNAREKYQLLHSIFDSKTTAELNEEERQIVIDLEETFKQSRLATFNYVTAIVKEGYEAVIDQVTPEFMHDFLFHLEMASLGQDSEKKNQVQSMPSKPKSNLKSGGMRKKK